ncbi:hypothetical protein ACIPF8_05365 [Collimonas sp. NPDC087041]|uniref:hypothetical protein n=1 Tax=Collimonas sp. NPDC087041 TaxID=3363960 RepID=UPI0038279219
MDRKNSRLQRHLYLASILILLAGLLSAGLVYYSASGGYNRALGYDVVGGNVYSVAQDESKSYRRDMEMYSGTSGLLIADFNGWLASLWHGKRLAYVLAIAAAVISYACFWVARDLDLVGTEGPED